MNEPTRSRQFNIMLSDDTYQRTRAHAATRETSIAQIVRTALLAYLDHEQRNEPTCANGQRCLCPNRWSRTERIRRLDQQDQPIETEPEAD